MSVDYLAQWLQPADGNPFDGVWRDLETGVNPLYDNPEDAHAANDLPGTPPEPIYTRLEGPWGLPWYDAVEDPYKAIDIPQTNDPLPWSPNEDVGGQARIGAFEGAFRTRGPVRAWGHEPSGGLSGDQALGRIMRFPANIPERYDPYGVFNTDPRDDLAAAMEYGDLPYQSDTGVTMNLLQWAGDY